MNLESLAALGIAIAWIAALILPHHRFPRLKPAAAGIALIGLLVFLAVS